VLHYKTAQEVGELMFLLEGVFVKIGQLISTMSNFLPDVYGKVLETTEDSLKSKPFQEVKKSIESQLGHPLLHVFKSIDNVALGVATIGQVHKAVLLNGEEVVVKVQHKNIDILAKADLAILKKVLKLVSYFINLKGFENVFKEIEQLILTELDYNTEANNLIEFRNNFKNDDRVKVPKVYKEYSTDKILVLEYMEGDKITKTRNDKKEILAENMVDVFCKSVLDYGLYHADPHPGNVLVNGNNQLVFLDFGAIGRFDDTMREGLILLFEALVLKDENLMIAGLKKMNFITNDNTNNRVCKRIFNNLYNALQKELTSNNIDVEKLCLENLDLNVLVSVIKKIDKKELEGVVNIPKEWVVLYRAVMLTLGVSQSIHPELILYKTIKKNLLEMFLKREKLVFKNTVQQQITRLITLPRKIEVFMDSFEEKSLNSTNNSNVLIYCAIQQMLYVITAAICYHFYLETKALLFTILTGLCLFFWGISILKNIKLEGRSL
ncbi:AarF/ABC1/UbiB kinase family protein, partial [Flavobacteriaceae bacterium]|nr:AarF/ABC1/UbiB kinase family protein [Flavobacteriaceae bacterium]